MLAVENTSFLIISAAHTPLHLKMLLVMPKNDI